MSSDTDLRARRALVMGLGHFGGGVGAARYLARRGARVTITDLADEARLADSLIALDGVPIHDVHLGGHREDDFCEAELVVINPAVHPDNPLLALAARNGARLTTEIELFLNACPCPTVGITGSNGKSTTAAMTAAAVGADGRRVWLGGNIGQSLLEQLDQIARDDWAVLEISSFQLHYLARHAPVPHVAVVTNCVPNHLNWHPSFEHYRSAKQRLLELQRSEDVAVLNTADPEVSGWHRRVRGRLLEPWPVARVPPLRVPGEHNRVNAACAAAAAESIGCRPEAIRQGLETFAGLSQRLEMIAFVGGRRFYNDSSATTPESTVAALHAVPGPLWLLAGGADKGANYAEMLAATATLAAGAGFFGAVGARLRTGLAELAPHVPCTVRPTMAESLQWCWQNSLAGHAILLSPGCASLDQFTNYRHRGYLFVALVQSLAAGHEQPELDCDCPGNAPC